MAFGVAQYGHPGVLSDLSNSLYVHYGEQASCREVGAPVMLNPIRLLMEKEVAPVQPPAFALARRPGLSRTVARPPTPRCRGVVSFPS